MNRYSLARYTSTSSRLKSGDKYTVLTLLGKTSGGFGVSVVSGELPVRETDKREPKYYNFVALPEAQRDFDKRYKEARQRGYHRHNFLIHGSELPEKE